jgi:DegV family protein with EDD domain
MKEDVAGRVALITDASACIPASYLPRLDLRVVPITVQVGDEEFRSGVDLEDSRLYRALQQGIAVKSAAPSPLDYLDAIEEAGDRPCVIITPAAEFTRMYTNACLAAELAGRSVTVVDSRSATAGHGLVVLAAGDARDAGGQQDDVVAAAEEAAARTELVACLETLDYLRQSGRVPALALGLANQLGIRPVFRLRNGTAERLGIPRSEQAALARIVREWRAGGGHEGQRAAVFHAARPELAEELARLLGGVSFITEFSAAMAIHTGPGVVGVAWLRHAEGELVL